MILLRDKSFSQISKIEDYYGSKEFFIRPCLEFMKAFEMFDANDGQDVKHWLLDKCVSAINELVGLGMPPQVAFIWCDDNLNSIAKVFGTNIARDFKNNYPSPESYIREVEREMRTGKEAGIVKYDGWFRAHPELILEPKEYVGLFKMIAMYFSGQFTDYQEVWINMTHAYRERIINYDRSKCPQTKSLAKPYIRKMLANIMFNLKGYDTEKKILGKYL